MCLLTFKTVSQSHILKQKKMSRVGSGSGLGPTRQRLSENPSQDPSDGRGSQPGLNCNGPMWF